MTQNNASATNTRAVFSKMLRLQLIATVVVAILALAIAGAHAGLSAVLGGGTVIIGAFFGSKIAQRSKQEATAVLINLLKAEAVKVIVIFVLLLIVFKIYKQLVPFALIAGLAAAALASGAAMSRLDSLEI